MSAEKRATEGAINSSLMASGKDERGVGYAKRNAIAGRSFESFAALEAHLESRPRETADQRAHGTTGEAPLLRFVRDV